MKKTAIIFLITLASCSEKDINHFKTINCPDTTQIFQRGYLSGHHDADSVYLAENLKKPQKYWYSAYNITHGCGSTLTGFQLFKIGDTTDANGCVIIIKSQPHKLK